MYPLVECSRFRTIKTARDLIRRQEFAQAEHLLAAALSRHPDHPRLLHQQALCATNSGACSAAVARWTRLVEVAPRWDVAWAGLVAIRNVAGDMPLAEAIVEKALIRFPSSAAVLVEAAGVLEQRGNLDEAVATWARLALRRRPHPHWEASYARCLIRLGSLETAAGVIRRGLRRTPGNIHLLLARTALAMARADWDGALADLAKSCVLVPTDEGAAELTKRVATLRQVDGASAEGRVEPSAADAIADPADLRHLMLAFESMGIDCEFGTVQRHYGAEPIGLLRWTDVACAKLIAALDASFDGIGDIDNIELVTDQKDIYYVEDRRFGLTMHTHLFASEIDAGTLLPKMSARIVYQRGKFLADLAEGRKTFVFKSEDPLDEIRALHAAMRRYGPLRLLNVRTQGLRGGPPEAEPGGSISIAPDLHVGYVSIAGHLPQTPYAEWERICAAVARAPAL